MSDQRPEAGLEQILDIARRASAAIMAIYGQEGIRLDDKSDDSPLTRADMAAHATIVAGLAAVSSHPILSEEAVVAWPERRQWKKFWLVDPLDGTKDFIAGNGDFTVNIALIEVERPEAGRPVLGVVAIPARHTLYWAELGKGAFCDGRRIHNDSARGCRELIASDSRFHSTPATVDFLNKHHVHTVSRFGSALKMCKLAEGEIDLYPRLNGTMEWDTAAAHLIANEAGCKLVDVESGEELVYGKENLRNNHFIASRNDLNFL